jgi:methyl-accepting chemotaxis protein
MDMGIKIADSLRSNRARLMLILLGFCAMGCGITVYGIRPGQPASARWMLFCLIAGAFLFIAAAAHSFWTEVKPSSDLMKLGRSLVDKDLSALAYSVTELAQGNLAVQSRVQSKPVEKGGDAFSEAMAGTLNDMVKSLSEISVEFNALTDIPCKRLCYVGADSFLEGRRCGELMGQILNGRGELIISTGFFTATGLELRRKGFICVLREKFPEIRVLEVAENHEDAETAYRYTLEALQKLPQLAGIYVTEGATPHAVARAVKELDRAQKVKVVGHDLTDETAECVKDQSIAATLGQNPFAQGYNPVIYLFNHLVAGWQPPMPRLLTQMEVISSANLPRIWEKNKGLIQSQEMLDRLAIPVSQASETPLKLAVLAREDSAFWIPVKNGCLAAAKRLREHNTQVDWIVPPRAITDHDFSRAVYEEAIENLVRQGYQGIATVVTDRNLVRAINQAVDRGIPVITFNSEPLGLRSLVGTITAQAQNLMGMSQRLAANTAEANAATVQITTTMQEIARGTTAQNEQVRRTESDLESLLGNIDRVSHDAGESATAAEEAATAVGEGTDAMTKTLSGIQSIEQTVGATWQIVSDLSAHSERIDSVVELIDDIASMVNVLALNASIEATRAGDAGKGFMVVANEIRRLSKRTAEATNEVTQLVGAVQRGINGAQRSIEQSLGMVKSSTQLTDKAKAMLSDIRKLVEANRSRISQIASSISDMQRISHQVGAAMENVSSVSTRNGNSIEEVNIATRQLNDQFSDVANLAQALEQISQSQQELLAKFNVE